MRIVAPLFLLSLLAACDPAEEPISCTRDFDCPVGQLCGADDVCTDAAGAERTFGEAVIDVGDPSETYLINVYSLPTDAEVLRDPITFSLTNGEPAGALRVGQPRQTASYDPAWDARIAFESERHARIDELVTDLRSGNRSLDHAEPRQPGCGECGPAAMCWNGECIGSQPGDFIEVAFADGTVVTCTLEIVDETSGPVPVNVLLDVDDSASSGEAVAAATAFAGTLAAELGFLGQSGHAGAIDRDGDGRLTVVFTNRTTASIGTDIVGFFLFQDFLPSGGTGNQADILWARPALDTPLASGTLAHEYTHLVSYATRVHARGSDALREALWLDEGIAHLMEDLTGWGGSNIGAVAWALANWTDSGFASDVDSVVQRGQAYLLLRHMIDQAGSGSAASAATESAARQLVSGLIAGEARGWSHSEFESADVGAMLLAAYATGRLDLVDSAHRADYLPVSGDKGISTHATRTDARGDDVLLDGPTIEDNLLAWGDPLENEIFPSGSIYYELSGVPAGQITITGRGTAAADLRLLVERVQ